ncbi:MAG: thiol-disulfide isomerase, partial [Thermoleophilia bacterium]|nr:thiol-disulfide isomerase [Thermoleophilia bacterium]
TRTLDLSAVGQPAPPPRRPAFVNATKATLPKATLAPGSEVVLDVTIPVEKGSKLNLDSALPYVVEAPSSPGLLAASVAPTGGRVDPPSGRFTIKAPLARPAKPGDAFDLTLSVQAFVCNEGSNLCMIKSYVWTIPVAVADGGAPAVEIGR